MKSMSDIFKSLLSCSEEQSITEKTVHVYDPKELQTGWQAVSCNAKYIACPTSERRHEQASPSVKSDLPSSKKRNKKVKAKERDVNVSKYDKFKSLGVLSYGVPSWRTIIDPETCTYVQRTHPCLYSSGLKPGDYRGLAFVDPAGVLDQHLGGFVQRQRARNGFHSSLGHNDNGESDILLTNSNTDIHNAKHYNPFQMYQMPLNDLKPIVEEETEFWPSDFVTTNVLKQQTLKPLIPVTNSQGTIAPSITFTAKNLPPVLRSKCSTIDRKTGRVHREVLHSQKLKLTPFKPYTPVHFQVVQPNRKQTQKLKWLPITTTSPCLSRSTPVDQSEVRKPTWSKVIT